MSKHKRKRQVPSQTARSGVRPKRRKHRLDLNDSSDNVDPVIQHSSILELPKEILLNILSHLLAAGHDPVTLHSANDRRWRNELQTLKCPQWSVARFHDPHYIQLEDDEKPARFRKTQLLDVLLVCRDFYFAGIKAFYGTNVLRFESMDNVHRFAEMVDSDRRSCVEKIMVFRGRHGFESLGVTEVTVEDYAAAVFSYFQSAGFFPLLKAVEID